MNKNIRKPETMIEALEDRGKGNQKYGKARRVEDVLRKL